jgi:hypothetical protein
MPTGENIVKLSHERSSTVLQCLALPVSACELSQTHLLSQTHVKVVTSYTNNQTPAQHNTDVDTTPLHSAKEEQLVLMDFGPTKTQHSLVTPQLLNQNRWYFLTHKIISLLLLS